MTEKFNLTWHTFQTHSNELLSDLYHSKSFCDVTLVCDDQTQFKAHKLVLSACSSVFENILISNSMGNHQLIYLMGITKEEMQAILHFMYQGEATFDQDRMNEFLSAAKALDVKEIGTNVDDLIQNEAEEKEEVEVNNSNNKKKKRQTFVRPVEGTELEIGFTCDVCNKTFMEKKELNRHIKHLHGEKVFHCQHCDYRATISKYLNNHMKSVHEGIRYPCNKCDFKATQVNNLNIHVKSVHEGQRYPCKQCDYLGTTQVNLKYHVQSKHDGVTYPCEQCDYKATKKHNLKAHVYAKHSGKRYFWEGIKVTPRILNKS